MKWFAEMRHRGDDGKHEAWVRISPALRSSREKAKSDCRSRLLAEPNNRPRLEFRILADDERGTIYEVCQPPHGWRLRWIDSRLAVR